MAQKFVGVLFLALGLWLLWSAAGDLLAARRYGPERATGVVVALRENRSVTEQRTSRQVKITYAPVVRFTTPDGRPVEFASRTSSAPAGYRVGESVPVSYDPADPQQRAEIAGYREMGLPGTLMGGFGLLFAAVGAFALLYRPSRSRPEPSGGSPRR
jgi:hypothetical protein